MTKCFALLLAAHFIADFMLQPDWLAKRKRNVSFLALHGLIHAATAAIVFQSWSYWKLPAAVFLVHILIDVVKVRRRDTAAGFAVDQAVHIAGLGGIVWALKEYAGLPDFTGIGFPAIIAVGGFVATVQGAGFFVGKFAKRLLEENKMELDGLIAGGKWIGQLERFLIFVFIFIGHPAGIGFLVAAKSILRFEEAKQQKRAEYVLIGTLLSFSLAIALASATKWAMGL
ncbi:MAG: DUF3307 domain-containing protein [Acidobacteriota bacterium]|nr:DUF3307 domain-containing protein [Acidobacteriota bacterium]